MLNTGIDDRYYFYALLAEFLCQAFRIRKSFSVESENAIPAHVIDVEMNYVQRQIALAILAHHSFNHCVGVVTPAALLIAQRPQRRQRHVTGKVGIPADDFLDRGPTEQIIIQLAT